MSCSIYFNYETLAYTLKRDIWIYNGGWVVQFFLTIIVYEYHKIYFINNYTKIVIFILVYTCCRIIIKLSIV